MHIIVHILRILQRTSSCDTLKVAMYYPPQYLVLEISTLYPHCPQQTITLSGALSCLTLSRSQLESLIALVTMSSSENRFVYYNFCGMGHRGLSINSPTQLLNSCHRTNPRTTNQIAVELICIHAYDPTSEYQ